MENNLDIRAFNEVRELKKEFNDNLVKKRFREKNKIFSFEGNDGTKPIKTISFEGISGTLLNLKIDAILNTSQTFYIKFNSMLIYKIISSENINFEINLELEKNNLLEFYSDGEIFVQANLKGNIDLQDLDNIEIIKLNNSYYVASDINGKIYFKDYIYFDSLAENFIVRNGNIKEDFVSYSNLIRNIDGLVYNYTLAILTGNMENGFVLTQSNEMFLTEHLIDLSYEKGALLPILNDYYRFGFVSFDNTSFFINYYDLNYTKVREMEVNYDLKYEIKSVGGFEYFTLTDYSHHGFWFIDKNNDAYLVLAKDGKAQELAFHNSPVYLGKGSRIKVYCKGNEFTIFLSFDNAVTKITLNITHDNYSLNASRTGKTSVKNATFGFLDDEQNYYYSNGYITKLT